MQTQERTIDTLVATNKHRKLADLLVVCFLLAFGIYHSILYFGHKAVPNPDFPGFAAVGHRLLSFQLPSNYKRAPIAGLLQVSLSHFISSPHPDLTAGWLLNAILHPFNVVLLWLIGRKIIGQSAIWVAIIAIINPWMIRLLCEPIAETTLLFFILLTFYFIFKRSNWCYLFASITTMTRYEGAALILIAFIMDVIEHKDSKKRLKAFIHSTLATIPLALWMLGIILNWESDHYLKELGIAGTFGDSLLKYFKKIWRMGFHPLLIQPPGISKEIIKFISQSTKILVGTSFCFSIIYASFKRNWNILALFAFLCLYIFVHAAHSMVFSRFCMPIHWIVLLMCVYGLQSAWGLINNRMRMPKPIILFLQGVLIVISISWLLQLILYLPKIISMSRQSLSIPYVAIGLVILILIARRFLYELKYFRYDIVASLLTCLVIVSNQFMLVRIVGNGQEDIEFKWLAEWHLKNAKAGEKMVTSLPAAVRIFVPKQEHLILSTSLGATSPTDFIKKCYEKDVTYITWDSRRGSEDPEKSHRKFYYRRYGMQNIKMLAKSRSIGPFEFITIIKASNRRFINIFRLRKNGTDSFP